MKCLIAQTGNRASGSHELGRTAYPELNWVRFCSWQIKFTMELELIKTGNPCLVQTSFLSAKKLKIFGCKPRSNYRGAVTQMVYSLSAVGALFVREWFKFERKKAFFKYKSVDWRLRSRAKRKTQTPAHKIALKKFLKPRLSILNFRFADEDTWRLSVLSNLNSRGDG